MFDDNLISTGKGSLFNNSSCNQSSAYHHCSDINRCSSDSLLHDPSTDSSSNASHWTLSQPQHESGQLRDLEDLTFLQHSLLHARNDRWDHIDLDWLQHVTQFPHKGTFENKYYLFKYKANSAHR